jgi:hypothetical protein
VPKYLICLLPGLLAPSLVAQHHGHGGSGLGTSPYYTGQGGANTLNLPPGTALNGVVGSRNGFGINGIAPFPVQNPIPCINCGRGWRGGGVAPYLGFGYAPFFSGYSVPVTYPQDETAYPYQGPAPLPDPNTLALTDEVDRLRHDMNQMKEARELATAAEPPVPRVPAQPEIPPQPPEPATVIVLRNGNKVETSNYAVMNQMLWNFSAKPLQKIPLSSIDFSASERVNADRGVDISAISGTAK